MSLLCFLPILAACTTFISMKISNAGMDADPSNARASQMKMMMYISPGLILLSGTALPSALSLYWTVGGIVSIIQSIIILNMKKKHKLENGL
ncbi:MAG: YidC/Oxa1 family membrane protein insertase [Paludibacteraceae bacterium]